MHDGDSSGVSQPRGVAMMLECSTGDLLARAAFMHHDDQGHSALMYYTVLKGLKSLIMEKNNEASPISAGRHWKMIHIMFRRTDINSLLKSFQKVLEIKQSQLIPTLPTLHTAYCYCHRLVTPLSVS